MGVGLSEMEFSRGEEDDRVQGMDTAMAAGPAAGGPEEAVDPAGSGPGGDGLDAGRRHVDGHGLHVHGVAVTPGELRGGDGSGFHLEPEKQSPCPSRLSIKTVRDRAHDCFKP